MISKAIMKNIFTVTIFVFWITQSTADSFSKYILPKYQTDDFCKDDSSNFSNIFRIKPYSINDSSISCLNLTHNRIEYIAKNAFRNLPNLTYLLLSDNNLENSANFFNFGGNEKLKILDLNDATDYMSNKIYIYQGTTVNIFGDFPNLEILYARNNGIKDMQYSPENISCPYNDSEYLLQTILFPKLKVLDLSENNLRYTGFVNLLSNSLQFLDLHENWLNSLNLREKGENLVTLLLDSNNFQNVEYTESYDSSLTLANLKSLEYLSISKNNINIINSTAFQDTNKLSYLDLSSNSIYELHEDTFANLYYLNTLNLSCNRLTNIPQISGETNISILSLHCNQIWKIIPNAFANMSKLTNLSLKINEIREIDVEAFANLSVLEVLDLSQNELSFLPIGWIEPLVSLKYLYLNNNLFTSLEFLYSTRVLQLVELNIASNKLKDQSFIVDVDCEVDTIAKFHSLSTLDLSYNQLENIPQVPDKINISVLYLNVNNIQKIIPNAFAQASQLMNLSLGYNKIHEIDVEAFAHLSVLEVLDLSNNRLNSLPKGWTKSLVSLKYLNLNGNRFSSLESLSLTTALPLNELHLGTNPLKYLIAKHFEDLPQNLTVNLIDSYDFPQFYTLKCKCNYGYYRIHNYYI